MNTYDFIFFDLDGTLTDSGPGIMNGFAYAIEKMGGKVSDPAELRQFVGPPLKDSFERKLGYSPEDSEKAIAFYREYYNDMDGRLQNSVYPGVEEMLAGLKAAGKKLIVATSKGAHGTDPPPPSPPRWPRTPPPQIPPSGRLDSPTEPQR